MKELKEYIRSIPDFPEKGIIFRDVRQLKKHMIWSTVRQRLKCIKMPLKKEKRLYFWMI